MVATLKLSDASPLELPRGLRAALLASGLFGAPHRSHRRLRVLATSLSSSLFSTSSDGEAEEALSSSGGVLLHGAPLPGCTLLVLDGFAPPTPARGGGEGVSPTGSWGEGGRATAASALASLLTGAGETARFLRSQSRVTLTSSGSPPTSAAFGVLEAARAGADGASPPPPRLPPLSPLALCPGAPIAVRCFVRAGAAGAEGRVRARICGRWIRLPSAVAPGALTTLPSLPPVLQGVVLMDGGGCDGAASLPKPRPLLLCHDGRIVAEVVAAEAALPFNGADSPQRDCVEEAVMAVGCALAAGAPIEAAAAGACHAIARGWLAAADACCRTVTAAAAAARRPVPRACLLGPNWLSLLHAAVASANPSMVERVLQCARDARSAYGHSDAGDALGAAATPAEADACVGVTPLHLALAVASSDGGALCAAALLGETRAGRAFYASEDADEADGFADAALAWARFPDGRGVTPSAAYRAASARAQPSAGIAALARLDARIAASVDEARLLAAAALVSCQSGGIGGGARYAFGDARARDTAAEADALVRSVLLDPPPPVADDDAQSSPPPPPHVLRIASASLRVAWSRPPSFEDAAASAALHPLARYAFLLCLLSTPMLRLALRRPDNAGAQARQDVFRAALGDAPGAAACVAPIFAGAVLALCVLVPALRVRVYDRFPTSTVAFPWTLAFLIRQFLMFASPSLTRPAAPHNIAFTVASVAISFMAACAPMRAKPLAWLLAARFAALLVVTPYLPVSQLSLAECYVAHAAAMAAGWAITAVCEAREAAPRRVAPAADGPGGALRRRFSRRVVAFGRRGGCGARSTLEAPRRPRRPIPPLVFPLPRRRRRPRCVRRRGCRHRRRAFRE